MKIYPGIVFAMFLGNLLMSIIAIRVAKKTGRTDVTSMPYGLDVPTTISMPLLVVGPIFLGLKAAGTDVDAAAIMAWHAGMAAAVVLGLVKIVLTVVANKVSAIVPLAGLLGAMSGIGIMIGVFALKEIFSLPLVGIISLGFILYVLIARIPLPKRIPGVLAGVVVCVAIYHILGQLGLLHTVYSAPVMEMSPSFPLPTLGFIDGFELIIPYLPLIIPFGILITIGDINVTVSANKAGDPYSPKSILLGDGINTFVGAVFGSITQTTAYAGQPAYKNMGCKIGYTLYSALFMGVCGLLGLVSFFIQLVPVAIFAPILVFVAIEIVAQGFAVIPKKHLVAAAFAMFPSAMKPMLLLLIGGSYLPMGKLLAMCSTVKETYSEPMVLFILVNGFIITGVLWGALVAEMIDKRLRVAGMYLITLSVFTFFGIIHSVDSGGIMYLPWLLTETQRWIVYDVASGYMILAVIFLILSLSAFSKHLKADLVA